MTQTNGAWHGWPQGQDWPHSTRDAASSQPSWHGSPATAPGSAIVAAGTTASTASDAASASSPTVAGHDCATRDATAQACSGKARHISNRTRRRKTMEASATATKNSACRCFEFDEPQRRHGDAHNVPTRQTHCEPPSKRRRPCSFAPRRNGCGQAPADGARIAKLGGKAAPHRQKWKNPFDTAPAVWQKPRSKTRPSGQQGLMDVGLHGDRPRQGKQRGQRAGSRTKSTGAAVGAPRAVPAGRFAHPLGGALRPGPGRLMSSRTRRAAPGSGP